MIFVFWIWIRNPVIFFVLSTEDEDPEVEQDLSRYPGKCSGSESVLSVVIWSQGSGSFHFSSKTRNFYVLKSGQIHHEETTFLENL